MSRCDVSYLNPVGLLSDKYVLACNDKMVDDLVLDRLKMMAKCYDSTKVGTGQTILWGDTRVTSVAIIMV